VKLKDFKESHPVEVAEYVAANDLQQEPAFRWWVPHTLTKKNRIRSAMKNRYFRKHQKYGIELPKTVQRALEIDRETGTTFWLKALQKEMSAVGIAFKILENGEIVPVGYTKINCHIIFDIKPNFTRKARLVAGGHMTDSPASITYASVVGRDSVRIAFLLAALNGLDIMVANIGNAYLHAPPRERVYIICGQEFGEEHVGKRALIIRALYGLKSSGAAWRSHLADVIRDELNFTPCKADNDVWMRKATKPTGEKYYEYLLIHTDDCLVVSMNPKAVLASIDTFFKLKQGSDGHPTKYLGADIAKYKIGTEERVLVNGILPICHRSHQECGDMASRQRHVFEEEASQKCLTLQLQT